MHEAEALFHIGGFGVTSVMTTAVALVIILSIVAIIGTRKLNPDKAPTGLANVFELGVGMLDDFLCGVTGKYLARKYMPLLGTLFVFILCCNYSGLLPLSGTLPGLAAPTSNMSMVAGLAAVTFLTTVGAGISHNGVGGFLKHYAKPVAFIFPLMLLDEFIHPVSLTLRLYGNVYGEEMVTHELFNMVPIGIPVIMQFLSIMMGAIQAMVFTMLAAIYIEEAVGHHEGEH